jgi:Zn finger protein HypA/HybF involved in hydrogenase expression
MDKLGKTSRDIQGSLWCTACKGKGLVAWMSPEKEVKYIVCPICKGSKQNTFKGKVPVEKNIE